MNGRRIRITLGAALVLALVGASLAVASQGHGGKHHEGSDQRNTFAAVLIGHEETPAVHTNGQGTLVLTLNSDNTISYTLTYSGLNSAASQAHIHLGQPNVAGGIVVVLCGAPKPACPAGNTSTPASVTGTIGAADVMAPMGQGLTAGDLAGFVQELKAGFTYVNVHTTTSSNGEIRGQIGGRTHGHGFGRD